MGWQRCPGRRRTGADAPRTPPLGIRRGRTEGIPATRAATNAAYGRDGTSGPCAGGLGDGRAEAGGGACRLRAPAAERDPVAAARSVAGGDRRAPVAVWR